MKRATTLATVVTLTVLMLACGDSSPSSPTVAAPPPQVPAVVTVTLDNPVTGVAWGHVKRFELQYDVYVTESAGTNVNINFISLEAKDPTNASRYEKSEVGANRMDGNSVSGNTTWERRLTFYMNLWLNGGYAFKITVDYTDQYGNHGSAVFKGDDYIGQRVGEQIRSLQ